MGDYTCEQILESKRALEVLADQFFDMSERVNYEEALYEFIDPLRKQLATRAQAALMQELCLEYEYGNGVNGSLLREIHDRVYDYLDGYLIPELRDA